MKYSKPVQNPGEHGPGLAEIGEKTLFDMGKRRENDEHFDPFPVPYGQAQADCEQIPETFRK